MRPSDALPVLDIFAGTDIPPADFSTRVVSLIVVGPVGNRIREEFLDAVYDALRDAGAHVSEDAFGVLYALSLSARRHDGQAQIFFADLDTQWVQALELARRGHEWGYGLVATASRVQDIPADLMSQDVLVVGLCDDGQRMRVRHGEQSWTVTLADVAP